MKAVSWVRNAVAFPPDKPHAKCRGSLREASKRVRIECKQNACLGEEIYSQLSKQGVDEFMEELDMSPGSWEYTGLRQKLLSTSYQQEVQGQEAD